MLHECKKLASHSAFGRASPLLIQHQRILCRRHKQKRVNFSSLFSSSSIHSQGGENRKPAILDRERERLTCFFVADGSASPCCCCLSALPPPPPGFELLLLLLFRLLLLLMAVGETLLPPECCCCCNFILILASSMSAILLGPCNRERSIVSLHVFCRKNAFERLFLKLFAPSVRYNAVPLATASLSLLFRAIFTVTDRV